MRSIGRTTTRGALTPALERLAQTDALRCASRAAPSWNEATRRQGARPRRTASLTHPGGHSALPCRHPQRRAAACLGGDGLARVRPAMRIFITGATGFIGSHVAYRLLEAGHELV